MASIVKKKRKNGGLTWYITYRISDNHGIKKQHWFRCTDKKEANAFLDDIEEAEKKGIVYTRNAVYSMPEAPKPIGMTVAELMEKYVQVYGQKNWQPSTLKTNRSIIENYINPYIGSIPVSAITPKFIQDFYDDLPNHSAKQGHLQNTPAKNISARTCKEVHKNLRPAFDMAVVWGEATVNPTLSVKLPKQAKYKRNFWTEAEFEQALSLCDNELLYLCMCLVFGCSLRSGELAGLTWDCVNANEETITANKSSIYIDKTVQRAYKSAIKETSTRDVIRTFPNVLGGKNTVMVLKKPKTETSIRRIFLPATVAKLLIEHKATQERQKAFLEKDYNDYGLVIAQDNGNPYDVKDLSKRFKGFIRKNGLREVDFYSLRHASVTAKLRATHDVKAVQGDTGHATADMLQNVYAGILDEDRRNNAVLMEERVFSKVTHQDFLDDGKPACTKPDETKKHCKNPMDKTDNK